MSGKPISTKPGGKRESRGPEPTGDSSDSSRSRSLSAGRSSSRRLGRTRRPAGSPSKWELSQYISDSDGSDAAAGADSVSTRVKFRRGKSLKDLVKAENTEALDNYKIPKKTGKRSIKDLTFGMSKSKTPSETEKQKLLAPSGSGDAGDAGDSGIVVGPSGKVLGYRPDSVMAEPSTEEDPTLSLVKEKTQVQGPIRSKIANGAYYPIIPASGPGSGQPKMYLGPPGVMARHKPYSKSKQLNVTPVPVNVRDEAGDLVVSLAAAGQAVATSTPVDRQSPVEEVSGDGTVGAIDPLGENTEVESEVSTLTEDHLTSVDPNNLLDYEPEEEAASEADAGNATLKGQDGEEDGGDEGGQDIGKNSDTYEPFSPSQYPSSAGSAEAVDGSTSAENEYCDNSQEINNRNNVV